MGDVFAKVRLAAVQAAPVFLNRKATVDKAIELIKQAGANGADIVGFPENFIPGHPLWYYYDLPSSDRSMSFATELYKNAVVIESDDVARLCRATEAAGTYVIIGLTEKQANQTGGMLNSQLFTGRDGRIIGKHQKLVPTITEKLVHVGGSAHFLRAVETDLGPVSGLICGENSNPLALMAICADYPTVHVASWPSHFRPSRETSMHQPMMLASRNVAYMCKCFVISAASTVSSDMVEMLARTGDDRAFLLDPKMTGGSSIIDPRGKVIAGPLGGDQEQILYADVDLEACVTWRLVHDFAGGYNRPDQLQLVINERDQRSVVRSFRSGFDDGPVVESDEPLASKLAASLGFADS